MGEASLSDLSIGIASGQLKKEIGMLVRASRFALITNQSLDFFEFRLCFESPSAFNIFAYS